MLSIPQLASVTMLVPPAMMISAEMLKNDAGLVPSIVALIISATAAATIPMPVAAFMTLKSASGSDTSAARPEPDAFARDGASVRDPHGQRHRFDATAQHLLGDVGRGFGDEDLLATGQSDHGIRVGLDGHDHLVVDEEFLAGMAKSVQGDHRVSLSL